MNEKAVATAGAITLAAGGAMVMAVGTPALVVAAGVGVAVIAIGGAIAWSLSKK